MCVRWSTFFALLHRIILIAESARRQLRGLEGDKATDLIAIEA